MSWILRALRRGILTTRYPAGPAEMPGRWRGVARAVPDAPAASYERGAAVCLSRAIEPRGHDAVVFADRCFQCGHCAVVAPEAFVMTNEFELAHTADPMLTQQLLAQRAAAFGRSVFIRHVDAGSDYSCDQEVQALFNPFYDLNRLGIFLTASPRHADMLLVTGAVTRAMEEPLRRTFAAMPAPKLVVAVGSAASSGSIYATDAIAGPVDRVVPVDVNVPGAPPPPLSIMHGIWVALGRVGARRAEPSA
jgi:Ni,Fe-hydrogenase III small subunit/ferredoxin